MITFTFLLGTEIIYLTVEADRNITFWRVINGIPHYLTFDKIPLSVSGILKEFPDLEGKPIPEIKEEARKRFKEHMKNLESVEDIKNYIRGELEKHGCKLLLIQRKGFRPEKP